MNSDNLYRPVSQKYIFIPHTEAIISNNSQLYKDSLIRNQYKKGRRHRYESQCLQYNLSGNYLWMCRLCFNKFLV